MKMSLHRALAEIKLLEKRIAQGYNSADFVTYQIGSEKPKKYASVEDFNQKAISALQSVSDLINRRNEIKAKLILVNATTTVKVGNVEMTIAEAIERKSSIEFDKGVLLELKRQLALVNSHMELEHKNMLTRLDQRITADLGSKDRKESVKEVEEITEAFLKRYQPNLVDPINIREKIAELETVIDEFETNVDYVLSEANATTFIEINE